MKYVHLEIMNHHLTHGAVWDGDQISKSARDELVELGLLWRVEGSGYHALTLKGSIFARRNRPLFLIWTNIKRLPIGTSARNFLRSLMPRLILT